jgi:hypothetical protein
VAHRILVHMEINNSSCRSSKMDYLGLFVTFCLLSFEVLWSNSLFSQSRNEEFRISRIQSFSCGEKKRIDSTRVTVFFVDSLNNVYEMEIRDINLVPWVKYYAPNNLLPEIIWKDSIMLHLGSKYQILWNKNGNTTGCFSNFKVRNSKDSLLCISNILGYFKYPYGPNFYGQALLAIENPKDYKNFWDDTGKYNYGKKLRKKILKKSKKGCDDLWMVNWGG